MTVICRAGTPWRGPPWWGSAARLLLRARHRTVVGERGVNVSVRSRGSPAVPRVHGAWQSECVASKKKRFFPYVGLVQFIRKEKSAGAISAGSPLCAGSACPIRLHLMAFVNRSPGGDAGCPYLFDLLLRPSLPLVRPLRGGARRRGGGKKNLHLQGVWGRFLICVRDSAAHLREPTLAFPHYPKETCCAIG